MKSEIPIPGYTPSLLKRRIGHHAVSAEEDGSDKSAKSLGCEI